MASLWCKSSAPANARLMGEHAVLRGGPALVFAVDLRMTVLAQLCDEQHVHISSKFGTEIQNLHALSIEGHHRFVKAAIITCKHLLPQGVTLHISSDFEHTVGLGSSAAVTVATIGALLQLTIGHVDPITCLQLAQKTIRMVQGSGSGADAAASLYGGVLLFYTDGRIQKLTPSLPLLLAYCGMKTPTKDVIDIIDALEQQNPTQISRIFASINSITHQAVQAIKHNDLALLGFLMNEAHTHMAALGLENEPLAKLKKNFNQDSSILGCKISGSGLGDCVVLLAPQPSDACKKACLFVTPSERGLETTIQNTL